MASNHTRRGRHQRRDKDTPKKQQSNPGGQHSLHCPRPDNSHTTAAPTFKQLLDTGACYIVNKADTKDILLQNPLEHPYTRFVWLKELPEEKLRPLTYACLANAKSMTPSLTHLLGISPPHEERIIKSTGNVANSIIDGITKEHIPSNYVVAPLRSDDKLGETDHTRFIAELVQTFASNPPQQNKGTILIVVHAERVFATKQSVGLIHKLPQSRWTVLTVDEAISRLAKPTRDNTLEKGVCFGIIDDSHTVEKIKAMALASHIPYLLFIGRTGQKDKQESSPQTITAWLENNATIYKESEKQEGHASCTGAGTDRQARTQHASPEGRTWHQKDH